MTAKMLGIMITQYANLEHIAGVTRAARKAGHRVAMFLTDEGVRFTVDPAFQELLANDGVYAAVCEYNCEQKGLHEKIRGITYGSQYDNAMMLHGSERVLVF